MIKIENLPANPNGALTLDPSCLYAPAIHGGWIVSGEVQDDFFTWVNNFAAVKDSDFVCGNFESEIWATNQEAYDDFIKNCPPDSWDYDEL